MDLDGCGELSMPETSKKYRIMPKLNISLDAVGYALFSSVIIFEEITVRILKVAKRVQNSAGQPKV